MSIFGRYKLISMMLIGLIIGCAGSSSPTYRDLRLSAGEANAYAISDKVQRILNTNLFELVRFEESTVSSVWETAWKSRSPFEDEIAQGIVEAQTKLLIQSRPKTGAGDATIYRVYLNAQNMVRIDSRGEWIRVPNTKQYTAYIRGIAYSLKSELDMTQRVFD